MNKVLKKYRNMLIQMRYSKNTISIYCNYFEDFCNYFKHTKLQDIIHEQINTYILQLIETKNISISQQNQRINAIKFYYEKILGKEKQYYELHRTKKEHKLPKVLSKNEVMRILKESSNTKHKCILMLIYSAGLRRSELIDLKISDID
jgi:site-specific recombinase XerD